MHNITLSNICCTCLSTDRNLSRLCDIDEGGTNLFFLLSYDPEAYDELCNKEVIDMTICWECKALIKRMCKFRDQACTAQKQLNNIVNQSSILIDSLSVLSISNHDSYDYEYKSKDKTQEIENFTDILSIKSDSDQEIDSDIEEDENHKRIEIVDIYIKSNNQSINNDDSSNFTIEVKKGRPRKKIVEKNTNYTTIRMTDGEMLNSIEERRTSKSFVDAEFKCVNCLEVHSDDRERQMHIKEAHVKRPKHIKCDICQVYISTRSFEEHRDDHYLKFKCHYCDFVCYNLLIIMKHLRVGHSIKNTPNVLRKLKKISIRKNPGVKPWLVDVPEKTSLGVVCSHCQECFENKRQRALHIIKVHKQRVNQCDKCGKAFTSAYILRNHQRSHEKKAQIEEISRSVVHRTRLRRTSHTVNIHWCDICKKNFSNAYNLKKHQRLHSGDVPDVLRAPCPVCGKIVRSDSMKLHQRVHDDREPTKCYECNKTFVSRAAYENHMKHTKTHAGNDAFSIKCPLCSRGFRTLADRRDHVDYWHRGVVTHKCHICDKILSSGTMLARHLKRVHYTEKKVHKRKMYLCQTCGKACRDISVFREHESLHTGVKLFSCKLCNRSYRTGTSLYLHKRRYHIETLKSSRYAHTDNDDDKHNIYIDIDPEVES